MFHLNSFIHNILVPNAPDPLYVWLAFDPHIVTDDDNAYDVWADVCGQMESSDLVPGIHMIFTMDLFNEAISVAEGETVDAKLDAGGGGSKTTRDKVFGVMGNHDWGDGDDDIWMTYVKPYTGKVYTPEGFTAGDGGYYYLQLGNAVFIALGDQNGYAVPIGRDGSDQLVKAGYPAGAVNAARTKDLAEWIITHPNRFKIVLTHQALKETTAHTGFAQGFEDDFHDPTEKSYSPKSGTSYINFFVDEANSFFHAEQKVLTRLYQNNPDGVQLHLHGHTHLALGDEDADGRTSFEKAIGNTWFINGSHLTKYHMNNPPSTSRTSRFLIPRDGLDTIPIGQYAHQADKFVAAELADNNTVGSTTALSGRTVADFVAANSEYLSRGNSTRWPSTTFHFSMLVNFDADSSGVQVQILSIRGTGGDVLQLTKLTTNEIRFNVWPAPSGTSVAVTKAITGYSAGTWYLLHAYYNADTLEIGVTYNDESYATTTMGSTRKADTAISINLGAHTAGGSPVQFFDGKMSNGMAWNRLLTSAEKTALYNSGSFLFYDQFSANFPYKGLEILWKLDEASGQREETSYSGERGIVQFSKTWRSSYQAESDPSTPANQPTSLVTNEAANGRSLDVSWTVATGSPTGYIVIRKKGSAPAFTPVDDTVYLPEEEVGTDEFCVFIGTEVSFTDDFEIENDSTYHYKVYSYNADNGKISYLTTSPLSDNLTMTNGASSPLNSQSWVVWYQADQETYGDGANVPTLTDQSGNGNDATGNNTPTFETTGIGGAYPCVRLTKANSEYFSRANVLNGTGARTVIIGCKFESIANNDILFDLASVAGANGENYIGGIQNSADDATQIVPFVACGGGNMPANIIIKTTDWMLLVFRHGASANIDDGEMLLNNMLLNRGSASSSQALNTANQPLEIGRSQKSGNFADIKLTHFLVANSELSYDTLLPILEEIGSHVGNARLQLTI